MPLIQLSLPVISPFILPQPDFSCSHSQVHLWHLLYFSLWGRFMFPPLSPPCCLASLSLWIVRMSILYSWCTCKSICHAWISVLPHSGWFFPLVLFICLKFHVYFCFYNSWLVLHCSPYFLYPFFGEGTAKSFPGSGCCKESCYEHSWAGALVLGWSILCVCAQAWYSRIVR